jgi:putative ABC transport system permease protein
MTLPIYYYSTLAVRSLKRNVVLTTLIIAAIAVGIAASMITLTIYRAMADVPLPTKSDQLFVPQIDNWGPDKRERPQTSDELPDQLSYTDATALLRAGEAQRKVAMYQTDAVLTPASTVVAPFPVSVRATTGDFFAMFQVPFRHGRPWTASDDDDRSAVAVITRDLNDRVFKGVNSVGMTIRLGDKDYRVAGVLDDWQPMPRFYDVFDNRYGKTEDVLLPFSHAIDQHMPVAGSEDCNGAVAAGWEGHLSSSCVWTQMWVELPTAAQVAAYRSFLANYARDQQRNGRFDWTARTALRSERDWLSYQRVVPDPIRVMVVVAFGFLLVCLVNATSLMLAGIMGRAPEICVRRALGASRGAIFCQYLIEAAVIGTAGGLLGLLLTAMGLTGIRNLFTRELVELTHLDVIDVTIAILTAVLATVIAGVYPTWRATRVEPAWQLKAQ